MVAFETYFAAYEPNHSRALSVVMVCQSCIRGGLAGSSEDDAISLSFGTFIQSSETTNNVPFTAMTFSNTV